MARETQSIYQQSYIIVLRISMIIVHIIVLLCYISLYIKHMQTQEHFILK